jgi:hypothetical protein
MPGAPVLAPVLAFTAALAVLLGSAPARAAMVADEATPDLGVFSRTNEAGVPTGWRVVGFPSNQKPLTRFSVVNRDGRSAVLVEADKSYGNLVKEVERWPTERASLSWAWRMERLPTGVDLRQRTGDDAGAKLCVFFDVPTSRVPLWERARLQMARLLTGEAVPPQALCYVWDSSNPPLAVGSSLPNAFTTLMKWVVLQSGDARKGQWVVERRNLVEDYRKAFGADMPPITGFAIGADTDNTQSQSLVYFSDLSLSR